MRAGSPRFQFGIRGPNRIDNFQPNARIQQRPFDDPAKATGSEEEIRAVLRRVRDEIRAKFEAYAAEIRS